MQSFCNIAMGSAFQVGRGSANHPVQDVSEKSSRANKTRKTLQDSTCPLLMLEFFGPGRIFFVLVLIHGVALEAFASQTGRRGCVADDQLGPGSLLGVLLLANVDALIVLQDKSSRFWEVAREPWK